MDYRKYIAEKLGDLNLPIEEIASNIVVPPDKEMGDYALPCFKFAKVMRKSPVMIAEELKILGCPKVVLTDLARSDMSEAVEDAFRYGKLVLATTTYNMEIFPFMREFVENLVERNYQNRTIGIYDPTF